MGKKYHRWTTLEERIIQRHYSGGRYKGIIDELVEIMQIAKSKIANHIREMRRHKRL
jgi:hypothetical protein